VIGVPDERWGEVGRALVVPRPGSDVSPDDIMDSLSGRLAKYKLPKSVVLVDTLPRNATGKILKARLRSQYGSAPARGTEEA
jgi:fatty-acyl-CoA synthase